jgi:superfamily II DNA/RNA helicase/cold shock CspA family protein
VTSVVNPAGAPSHRRGGRRRRDDRPAPARVGPIAAVPPAAADNGFVRLGVPAVIAGQLAASGIVTPLPIQELTLADALAGRDLLGQGQTGSGKTLAFALPLVAALADSRPTVPGRPRGLVLVPTRELALQVADVIAPLAATVSLRVVTVFGGVGQRPQVAALRAGVDIVVACPGRLEDLLHQGRCRLDDVAVTVIDEADLMSDLGFLPAVRRLLDATPRGGQRLLFSATLDRAVTAIVDRFLVDPVVHATPTGATHAPSMDHHLFTVEPTDKSAVVRALVVGGHRTLLFARTKRGAAKWAKQLTAAGTPAVDLHGNLTQGARERNLAAFASGRSRVLVATDIAARGIHVDGVELVVHVDPPAEHKAYLHRSGRTARAGASGVVVTLATPDQINAVTALTKAAGITARHQRVNATSATINAIAAADRGAAWPKTPVRRYRAQLTEVRSSGPSNFEGEGVMPTGTVKHYDSQRGFGFISRENAEDLFFHKSQIDGAQIPQVGQKVEFQIGPSRKGGEEARTITTA